VADESIEASEERLVVTIRTVIEAPFSGGERFRAVAGPTRALRRTMRWLLALTIITAGISVVLTSTGGAALGWLVASGVGVALWATARWIGGENETLLCERGMLVHRRPGPWRNRRRALSTEGLLRIQLPSSRGVTDTSDGIRIGWPREGWTVFRFLRAEEGAFLAEALRRHLSPRTGDPVPSIPFPRRPDLRVPARSAPETILRARVPRPRR
jgi:hypothetical protein